jgi:CubicO group peptidase (beta-lactamase class C family)
MTAVALPQLEALVRSQMEAQAIPGVAVGILAEGEIQTWGFGVASIETNFPVLPDSLFQIGSITKVFTTTAIMQFVDEGTLDLDAPVKRALPDFRLQDAAATETVTVRHLLTHTGGFFGDRFRREDNSDYGMGDDALGKALAEFGTLRQYTPPGQTWSYCNTGFQALGGIVERFTGQTVEQAIRERVLTPLGLERSVFFPHEAITYAAAVGHNKPPSKELAVARPYPLVRAMNAAGGIIGSVGDLLRFAQFHMGDGVAGERRVLSAESIDAMLTVQTEAGLSDYWGLGWSLDMVDGTTVAGHGGTTNGFRAKLTLVPERRVALALLANSNGGRQLGRALEAWFLERYTGLRRQEPRPPTLSADQLSRLTGHYRGPTSEIDVAVDGNGLQLDIVTTNPLTREVTTWPTEHLTPLTATRFVLRDGESAGEPVGFIGGGERPAFMRYHGRLVDRVED